MGFRTRFSLRHLCLSLFPFAIVLSYQPLGVVTTRIQRFHKRIDFVLLASGDSRPVGRTAFYLILSRDFLPQQVGEARRLGKDIRGCATSLCRERSMLSDSPQTFIP